MDKYRRVPREKEPILPDEIRITSLGKMPKYVAYASKLFEEQNLQKLTIKATGNAIASAVTLAEVLKRRFKGLHQLAVCGNTTIEDLYEPKEEGLDQVKEARVMSILEITLSYQPFDTHKPGYQEPLNDEEAKEFSAEEIARAPGRRVRGRGRGGSGRGRGGRGGWGGVVNVGVADGNGVVNVNGVGNHGGRADFSKDDIRTPPRAHTHQNDRRNSNPRPDGYTSERGARGSGFRSRGNYRGRGRGAVAE